MYDLMYANGLTLTDCMERRSRLEWKGVKEGR